MSRPRVLVVTPSVEEPGGTESIFQQELERLAEVAELGLVAPTGATAAARYGRHYPVGVPPLPGWLRTEAWFVAATRKLKTLVDQYPIRYSPGMNALGVTHATVHAIFAQFRDQLATVQRPLAITEPGGAQPRGAVSSPGQVGKAPVRGQDSSVGHCE